MVTKDNTAFAQRPQEVTLEATGHHSIADTLFAILSSSQRTQWFKYLLCETCFDELSHTDLVRQSSQVRLGAHHGAIQPD